MPDTMIALMPRDRLPGALATFHREGYGPVVRVMDPDRAPFGKQLERAGVGGARLATASGEGSVLIYVHSPGRAKMAAAIAVAQGATDVELAKRDAAADAMTTTRIIETAQQRRMRRSRQTPAPQPSADISDQVAD